MTDLHVPVMVREAVEALVVRSDGVYLDGTTGTGGHAEAILQSLSPDGRLIALDQDPDALSVARVRLGDQGGRVEFKRGSFHELDSVLAEVGVVALDGILLDLGLNSWSLSRPEKGLSYSVDGPLGMRLDPTLERDAAGLVAAVSEEGLVRIFTDYGDVRRPRLFARRIVEARRRRRIETTWDLVRALRGDDPGPIGEDELSRIFQSLRVEVCCEMERLERFLECAAGWIAPRGRLVVISYASQEDRRVKDLTRRGEGSPGVFVPLLRSPLRPGEEEVRRNRRARSARMRVFEKGGG